MMQLSYYPDAIVQAAQRVNEIDSQLMAVQQQINRFEGNADRSASFDMDLKNDAQRKARRFEVLLVNQEYQKAIDTQIRLLVIKQMRSLIWNICVTSLVSLSWKRD